MSAGGDRSVFIWDVATASTLRRLSGHLGKVHAVEFNEDASVVASGMPRCTREYIYSNSDVKDRMTRL